MFSTPFSFRNPFIFFDLALHFFSLPFERWKEGNDDNVTTAGCYTLDFILTTASHKRRKKEKGRRKKNITELSRLSTFVILLQFPFLPDVYEHFIFGVFRESYRKSTFDWWNLVARAFKTPNGWHTFLFSQFDRYACTLKYTCIQAFLSHGTY